MSQHIFVSYSREDAVTMQRVRDSLRTAGLTVWTDEGIAPGTPSWKDSIQDALENAACVVVVLSPDAKRSRWVKSELDYAEVIGLRIFPLLVKGDERTSLPFSLISAHYADLRGDYVNGMRMLSAAIRELVGKLRAVEAPDSQQVQEVLVAAVSPPAVQREEGVISIAIVDDIPETRENFRKLLAFEPDFQVIGTAGTGREGIELVKRMQPNIVLMDINMPDMDGITATAEIMKAFPAVAVIMISVQNDAKYIRSSMLAGARMFLTKPVGTDELYSTIREVHKANRLRL